jgi:hypothetical protein
VSGHPNVQTCSRCVQHNRTVSVQNFACEYELSSNKLEEDKQRQHQSVKAAMATEQVLAEKQARAQVKKDQRDAFASEAETLANSFNIVSHWTGLSEWMFDNSLLRESALNSEIHRKWQKRLDFRENPYAYLPDEQAREYAAESDRYK